MGTEDARDIYNSIQKYEKSKEQLKNNADINSENRQLFLDWLEQKEDELRSRKGRDHNDQIRYCKTLSKYILMLRNVDRFFNSQHLKELTEEDMKEVFEGMEEGTITTFKNSGKMPRSTRQDFYSKIFKSSFFEYIGKIDIAKKVFKLETDNDSEVRFFEKKDLDRMAKFTNSTRNEFLLYLLMDSGIRIGTALNIKAKDFEQRNNVNTGKDYYVLHVKKEYTKSKKDRTIGLMFDETNELCPVVLDGLKKDSIVFDFSYNNAKKIIHRVTKKAKVTTKPNGEPVRIHDFRKSCATHFLVQGFSIDWIKSRLGHKPSSTVIDNYVSYLGLSEDDSIVKMQDMNYDALKQEYSKVLERLQVLDGNVQEVQDQLKHMTDQNVGMAALFSHPTIQRALKKLAGIEGVSK